MEPVGDSPKIHSDRGQPLPSEKETLQAPAESDFLKSTEKTSAKKIRDNTEALLEQAGTLPKVLEEVSRAVRQKEEAHLTTLIFLRRKVDVSGMIVPSVFQDVDKQS